jgi:DNA-binding SARP family transcriptional activator
MTSPAALSFPTLKIILLGGFAVYIDGQILSDSAIKGRKARSLLKLLAHQRQYQLVRDHAVDILWPDLKSDAANAQLYKALYHIRKAFAKHHNDAENWIRITDELIRITPPGGLVTDTALFTQSARKGLKNKNSAELERALSLYAGEFLPMDRYSDWASFPREHYRQLYLDVLSALAEAYENQ